jgi:hypothetical protein
MLQKSILLLYRARQLIEYRRWSFAKCRSFSLTGKNRFFMGKMKYGILDAFSGTIGRVVGAFWRGVAVMRSKAHSRKNANTPKRQEQKAKSEFSDFQGLSIRNFKYMRTFAEAYPHFPTVQDPLAQITDKLLQRNQLHRSI